MCIVLRDDHLAVAYHAEDFDRFERVARRQFTPDASGLPTYREATRPWVVVEWVRGAMLRQWQTTWADDRRPSIVTVLDSFSQWAEILGGQARQGVHHGRITDRSPLRDEPPGRRHHVVGWGLIESDSAEQRRELEKQDCLQLLALIESTLEELGRSDRLPAELLLDLRVFPEQEDLRFADIAEFLRRRSNWLARSSDRLVVDLTAER
jgi:hypothetical protein